MLRPTLFGALGACRGVVSVLLVCLSSVRIVNHTLRLPEYHSELMTARYENALLLALRGMVPFAQLVYGGSALNASRRLAAGPG